MTHAYAVQSNVENVAGMALLILLAMFVNSMIYVSFYLFGHRLSPLRYRPFIWLGLIAGLFVSIVGIPAYEELHFYGGIGSAQMLLLLKGLVDFVFAAVYILCGISWL